MDEDQWTYDSLMYEEFDMDFEDEEQCGVNERHHWCGWGNSVSICLIQKYKGCFQIEELKAIFFNFKF